MDVVLDIIVGIVMIASVWHGFRKGFFKTGIQFLGFIIVIVLGFLLKDVVSDFFYKFLPFLSFEQEIFGKFQGIDVLNIVLYEGIAYILVVSVLMVVWKLAVMLTGILETILKFTIVLGIPSKILGMFVGLLMGYFISYVGLFCYNQFTFGDNLIKDSKISEFILTGTPLLNKVGNDLFKAFDEIRDVAVDAMETEDKTVANTKVFDIVLKYKLISVDSADKLLEKDKVNVENAEEIVDKYR